MLDEANMCAHKRNTGSTHKWIEERTNAYTVIVALDLYQFHYKEKASMSNQNPPSSKVVDPETSFHNTRACEVDAPNLISENFLKSSVFSRFEEIPEEYAWNSVTGKFAVFGHCCCCILCAFLDLMSAMAIPYCKLCTC